MAHLQKRNGKWQARNRDHAGREHGRRFDRNLDAERWLRDQAVAVDRATWIPTARPHAVRRWA